jgi:GMP synthase (glutamine-hydrolysing)
MDRPRVALLNASYEKTDTRRNFRRELDATVEEFDAVDGHVPGHADYDGLVITGSKASVYWDEDWIDPVREYAAGAVEAGVPALGVCWGHQLLADALGGEVSAMGEDTYEIGYRTVETTERGREDPIFEGIDPAFTVFTTHGDEVVELPPGGEVLAENDYAIQSFRAGPAVGVQFHPEYDPETARSVTRSKDFLPAERREAVLAGITDDAYAEACRAKQLFANFTRRIRAGRAAD